MACLHRLNVRDQGLRQEDAKNLKPKPGEAVSVGAQQERAGTEGKVHGGAGTAHQPRARSAETSDAAQREKQDTHTSKK